MPRKLTFSGCSFTPGLANNCCSSIRGASVDGVPARNALSAVTAEATPQYALRVCGTKWVDSAG